MSKKIFLLFFYLLFAYQAFAGNDENKIKVIVIDGQDVQVTHQVDSKFIGKYAGVKSGFLILNKDGTGLYMHDESGMMNKDCPPESIDLEWGFLVNELGEIVKFERPYGLSYPVIYKAIGEILFQGCSKPFLVDYILVKKSGIITISSSSDWIKK